MENLDLRNENGEIWKPVVGFEHSYRVSNSGNVESINRTISCLNSYTGEIHERIMLGQKLKPKRNYNKSGRLKNLEVSLSEDGRGYFFTVHKLVMRAFIGPRPYGLDIAHNDSNPANNCLSNLRYCTHIENCYDRIANNTHPAGSNNPAAKLDEISVLAIRSMRNLISVAELATLYGVSRFCIYAIHKRETWTHVEAA